jgi:multidrug efflux system outer membrane protein
MVDVGRKRRSGRRWLIPLAAAAVIPVLTGCILTADTLDPALDIPNKYRGAPARGAHAALPRLEWWRSFRSAELTDLMDQAVAANFDIAAAIARIVQADAQARIAGAALLPSLSGNANVTRSRPSSNTGTNAISVTDRTNYQTSLSASYVLDFWGRNRALIRAAESNASASRFDREVVELTTLVSVANAYFLVLEAQDRLRVANENLQASERILKVIQDRFAVGGAAPSGGQIGAQGSGSALDVAQQAALVAIQRASLPPLVEQAEQNRATLALLVGRAPEHIRVKGGSMYRLAIPRVTPGLPSDLLAQRPDIREAEARLAGADANVEAARAAFFPTIQLTGQGGVSSAMLSNLFAPGSGFYSVAASAAQPIFDGGTLLGQLDLQKGMREELLANYRKAVISGFTDVERALIAVQQLSRQETLERQAVAESRRAFNLSEERFRAGTLDLTTLLQTQQTLFVQEDALAVIRFNRLQAVVLLYQALGGGWEPRRDVRTAAP